MEDFKSYLLSSHVLDEKKAGFYLYWVGQFYRHCNKFISDRVESEDIDRYLKFLEKCREDWQVKQASEAIELYLFFRRKKEATRNNKRPDVDEQWKSVVVDMKKMLRLKHLSLRTEQTYLGWVQRFYRFVNGQPPNRLDSTHVKDFMTPIWQWIEVSLPPPRIRRSTQFYSCSGTCWTNRSMTSAMRSGPKENGGCRLSWQNRK
jgi:hypothetical protein